MPTLPPAMLALLAPFAPLFGRRVWPSAVVLVVWQAARPRQADGDGSAARAGPRAHPAH